nr:auxin responsive SAUR protein [Tanacetum cinerariifolium]
MKKNLSAMLRKCKALSRQLVRSSSYTSLRSKSTMERENGSSRGGIMWNSSAVVIYDSGEEPQETVYVGSTRKRYVISSKYLSHPVVDSLVQKTSSGDGDNAVVYVVNCEVVLFDHLLWMLENTDVNHLSLD